MLFYILVGYILLQFIWWEVLLVKQTRDIYKEKQRVSALNLSSAAELEQTLIQIKETEQKKIYMIVGEGTVFLILLTFGILKVYQTYKKERELAALQKNFMLSITHELKSPIASVRLGLETLKNRKLDEQVQNRLYTNAIADTDRLHALVEKILLAAQIENQRDYLVKSRQNISQLLSAIIANYHSVNGFTIENKIDREIYHNFDPLALESIVTNLIDNAIKYAKEEQSVSVELIKKEKGFTLKVSDKGIGIPDDKKNLIFEKFVRLGEEETRKTKGTGLGLYIVKRLTDDHQGTIKVADRPGGGTVFELNFR